MRETLARAFRSRWLPVLLVLPAVGLTLPSLGVGFLVDDYYHRAILLEREPYAELFGPPSGMFRFLHGDPERTRGVMDVGFLPWWTYEGLKAEFLQFLPTQTHRLDYLLWPDSPALMHAQSIFWYALVVLAIGWYYRRMFAGAAAGGLAAVLFALEDAHGPPVGWIANRNVMLALFFGALAWIVHDLWRRDGRRWGMVAAPVLLGCSLISKEAGIATCAYLAAYALFVDRAGPWRGCLALVPSVAVVVLWRIVRGQLGYGVEDMGLYIDPLGDPGRFVAAAAFRAPILLLGQWGVPSADLAMLLPPGGQRAMWAWAVAVAALLFVILLPLLRRRALARFWFAGMVFAVVPVCATFPMDRLLFFVGVGAFGLLAEFLRAVFFDPAGLGATGRRRVPFVLAGCLLVGLHLGLAPLLLPVRAGLPPGAEWLADALMVRLPSDESIRRQDVILVNPPSPMHAGYLSILCDLEGRPAPRTTRVLGPGLPSTVLIRVDARTLAVRPEGGFLGNPFTRLLRPRHRPMLVGERVELPGMAVEVTELIDATNPAERFRFDVPLEDPSLRWVRSGDHGFEPFDPPDVGQRMELRIGPFWER